MALTRDRAHDIIHCAAVMGWERMSHAMVSMTTALVQLRPTHDHLVGLASGFWAVAALQGTLLYSHAGRQIAFVVDCCMI